MAASDQSGSFACEDVRLAAQQFGELFGNDTHSAEAASVATLADQQTVRNQLEQLAAALLHDHQSGDPRAAIWIKNWHPRFVGNDPAEIMAGQFTAADARLVVAKDQRFADWADVEARGDVAPNPKFEQAVDTVVTGDLSKLEQLLQESPELAQEQSAYGHGATLLYYLAANGIEIRRQKSPYNAAEIAKTLIAAGADPQTTANSYGQACPVVNALVTSGHPAEAGVQGPLLEVLLDAGAAVNGPLNDGAPLSWALAFGQMNAARILSSRGARIPDLVSAASLGRVDLFEQNVNANGQVAEPLASYKDPFGKIITDAGEILGRALLAACKSGELAVCEWLLNQDISANFANDHDQTGLHFAAYGGYRQIVELLLQNGADASGKDSQHGTTPAVWAEIGGHAELAAWLKQQTGE